MEIDLSLILLLSIFVGLFHCNEEVFDDLQDACAYNKYNMKIGRPEIQTTGYLEPRSMSFDQCIMACDLELSCHSVVWKIDHECVLLTEVTSNIVPEDEYMYVIKLCIRAGVPHKKEFDRMAKTPYEYKGKQNEKVMNNDRTGKEIKMKPKSLLLPRSPPRSDRGRNVKETPPLVYPTPAFRSDQVKEPIALGESGQCPSPFSKMTNITVPGGQTETNQMSKEQCKMMCLIDESCIAVSYNHDSKICTTYENLTLSETMALKTVTQNSDHYRKTYCEPLQCFEHSVANALLDQTGSVEHITYQSADVISGLEITECRGACRNSDILSTKGHSLVSRSISRTCVPIAGSPRCDYQTVLEPSGSVYTQRCDCHSTLCNAMDYYAQNAMTLHLPLDQSVNDFSFYGRGLVSHGILYDHLDAMRGASGYFDGRGYIMVPSFIHRATGRVTDHDITPELSIALWIKSPSLTEQGPPMSVISSDVIQMTLISQQGHYDTVRFSLMLDNNQWYSVQGQADFRDWQFVSVVLRQSHQRHDLHGQLYLNIGSIQSGIQQDTELIRLPQLDVGLSTTAMFIGKDSKNQISPFKGLIDELLIFDISLNAGQLQSLYDVSMMTKTGSFQNEIKEDPANDTNVSDDRLKIKSRVLDQEDVDMSN